MDTPIEFLTTRPRNSTRSFKTVTYIDAVRPSSSSLLLSGETLTLTAWPAGGFLRSFVDFLAIQRRLGKTGGIPLNPPLRMHVGNKLKTSLGTGDTNVSPALLCWHSPRRFVSACPWSPTSPCREWRSLLTLDMPTATRSRLRPSCGQS